MTTTCLSCGHHFKGNFCPNCGQKATVNRITTAVLLEDILHFFTHLEHGFVYTTWNFLIRPGISSLEYLSGKRKKYQTPASFFLIWTGLYILIHNAIIHYGHYEITNETAVQLNIGEQSNILFRNHFSLFIIPVILLSAFLIYMILARPRYNFAEILTICLYGAGVYFMMCLFSDCILGLIFKHNILSGSVFLWQSILSICFNFWFSFDLFKRLHVRLLWLRLISTSILVAGGGLLIMFYLPMAWIHFTR